MEKRIQTFNAAETIKLGQKLGSQAKPGDILCLSGDLGSGKTTLVKGIAKGLKINPSSVHSPTFVLMNIYEGKIPLYHFDLYRLEDQREVHALGYEEFLYGDGLCVVEWAERLEDLMPKEYLSLELIHEGKDERLIQLSARGERFEHMLNKINEKNNP